MSLNAGCLSIVLISSSDNVLWRKYQEIRYILLNPTYNGEQNKSTFKRSARWWYPKRHEVHATTTKKKTINLKVWKRRYTRKSSVFRSFICAEITESLETILKNLPLNVPMFGYRIAGYSLIAMIMKLYALEALKQALSSQAATRHRNSKQTQI